jgi:hypothetical protein
MHLLHTTFHHELVLRGKGEQQHCCQPRTSKQCLSLIMDGCTASSARRMTFCMPLNSSFVASAPEQQQQQQQQQLHVCSQRASLGRSDQACHLTTISAMRPHDKHMHFT